MQVSITKYIIKKLQQALGIIQDTNTASQAIAKGKFVFWKGTLKKAKSAISNGDTLSSSNLDDVSGGALNNEMGEANSMYAGTPGIVPTPPAGNSVLTNHGWQDFKSGVPTFTTPILGGDYDYTTCSSRAIGTKFDELNEHIANFLPQKLISVPVRMTINASSASNVDLNSYVPTGYIPVANYLSSSGYPNVVVSSPIFRSGDSVYITKIQNLSTSNITISGTLNVLFAKE